MKNKSLPDDILKLEKEIIIAPFSCSFFPSLVVLSDASPEQVSFNIMSGEVISVFKIPKFVVVFPVIHGPKKGVCRNGHSSRIARYMNDFSLELFRKIVS